MCSYLRIIIKTDCVWCTTSIIETIQVKYFWWKMTITILNYRTKKRIKTEVDITYFWLILYTSLLKFITNFMYKFYFCGILNNFTFIFCFLQTMQKSSHIMIKIWLLSKIIFLHVNNMAFFVPKIWTYHNCYFDKHNKEYLDFFYHLTKQILIVFFVLNRSFMQALIMWT